MASSKYTYHICTADNTRGFEVGEEVFVHLKSDRDTGRAVVLQTPATVTPAYAGRYQVQYTCDASLTYHVRPARLCRVAPRTLGGPQLLVCASTTTYRRLARSQVTPGDKVLELGSSYGLCTRVLAHHAGPDAVLGIDNSHQLIAASQAAFPDLSFLVLDVLEQPGELRRLAQQWKFNVVFVDIGGNRALEALLRLLPWLQQELAALELIVVKSEELAAAAQQRLQEEEARVSSPAAEPHPSSVAEPGHGTHSTNSSSNGGGGPDVPGQAVASSKAVSPAVEEVAVTWVEVPGGSTWWQQLQTTQAAAAAAVACAPPTPSGCATQDQQNMQQGAHDSSAGGLPQQQQQQQQQQQHEQAEGLPASSSSRVAEPWYIKEKEAGFRRNPLRYPQRFTPAGLRICRPHNYSTSGCLKADTCPFDHDHCHHCGAVGHRGVACPVGG